MPPIRRNLVLEGLGDPPEHILEAGVVVVERVACEYAGIAVHALSGGFSRVSRDLSGDLPKATEDNLDLCNQNPELPRVVHR